MPPTPRAMLPGGQKPPEVWDWRSAYEVVDPSAKEIITFTLWERQLYTSAATLALTFFQAGTNGINGNLAGAGQLPAGWFFRMMALRIGFFVRPTTEITVGTADAELSNSADDTHKLITTGTARINVGDKEYGRWPLFMLPGGGGLWAVLATGGTAAAGTDFNIGYGLNGPPDPRAVYTLPINIGIPPQYNFRITLEWNAVVTFSTGAGATAPVFVMLDGQLMRPKQ